jgi:serine/threonine protein kinase
MDYPLISEYMEAIKAAEENFDDLKYLHPVLDEDGNPVMSSGNFAVVFKMKNEQTGNIHAVKCFLKEQEGRAEAYRQIAEELEYISSTFLTSIKYIDKELFVDTNATDETEFPVLLMDWIEGVTLDKYVREHRDNQYELALLTYQFSRLAMWLMPQSFAHGDLKPDNILVRQDGTLVLVDYDGMYVPAMKGQKARELGSPDFRHPSRTEEDFNEHMDDFSLVSILLSLKAISLQPDLLEQYGSSDRLLFSQEDYRNLSGCMLLKELYPSVDSELNVLLSLFTLCLEKKNLSNVSFRLLDLNRPKQYEMTDEELDAWYTAMEAEYAPYEESASWPFVEFAKDYQEMELSFAFHIITEDVSEACYFRRGDGKDTIVYNESKLSLNQIYGHEKDLKIELRKSGHYVLCGYTAEELLSYSTKTNEAMDQSVNLVMKETLDQFQGKEYVRHIINPSGTESWMTDDRSFMDEAYKTGASKINTIENDKKHVLFLFNNSNVEVGRYYMGKKLQGQTPEQIAEQKPNLTIFDSWNPATKQWVPCISTNQ